MCGQAGAAFRQPVNGPLEIHGSEPARTAPARPGNPGARKHYVRLFTCWRAKRAATAGAARVSSALGHIRSGAGTPSRPRPVLSTRRVSAQSASLLARSDCGSAFSTGHSS